MPTKTRENPNQGRIYDPDGIASCLNKMDGGGREPHIALPCFCDLNYGGSQLTKTARCLQGRYAKGICGRPGETSGVAVPIGGVYTSVSGEYQRGIKERLSRALKSENHCVYAVWYEKYQCYIAIRKLTPKECFRLQGWTDDYFERAAFVNSDSQLYKQAGNGVTVPVIQEIGERMK